MIQTLPSSRSLSLPPPSAVACFGLAFESKRKGKRKLLFVFPSPKREVTVESRTGGESERGRERKREMGVENTEREKERGRETGSRKGSRKEREREEERDGSGKRGSARREEVQNHQSAISTSFN